MILFLNGMDALYHVSKVVDRHVLRVFQVDRLLVQGRVVPVMDSLGNGRESVQEKLAARHGRNIRQDLKVGLVVTTQLEYGRFVG